MRDTLASECSEEDWAVLNGPRYQVTAALNMYDAAHDYICREDHVNGNTLPLWL